MLEISAKARDLISQNNIEIQLIVEIDGIDFFFGVSPVKSLWKVGDANIRVGDPGLFVGGIVTSPKSKSLIDPAATSKTISQQLEIEKGVSSVSSLTIRVIDENNIATSLFSPDATSDILSRGCTIYIGLKNGSHPEDSIRVFDGMISGCSFGAGFADLTVSHPEQFKRQAIFPKWEGEILTDLPASVVGGQTSSTPSPTVIDVTTLEGLVIAPNAHGFYNYFKLDTEIMKFKTIDTENNKLSILETRNAFVTDILNHEINDQIESFFYIESHPIDLALKLLCSKKEFEPEFYAEGLAVTEIVNLAAGENKLRIKCNAYEVAKANIQVGDSIFLSGSGTGPFPPANTVPGNAIIVRSISYNGEECFLFSDKTGISDDLVNKYTFSAISQWNVLSDGCGIQNRYIDFEEFERIRTLHNPEFTTCKIFLKDTIEDAKEFIEQVILRPQGLYTLPRKGRISVGKTAPPIANKETKVFNETNVLNAKDIKISRSINNNFYNAVIYKFNEDPLEDKFQSGSIVVDTQSFQKIKVGNRPLTIEARSLRASTDTSKLIATQTKRLLERFKFAAETLSLVVDFETGVNIDVGDTAVCQFRNLAVSDITKSSRDFEPRLMEVMNKELNVTRGEINLSLMSTIFEVDGRYATISPSSKIKTGSTANLLYLNKSQSRQTNTNEKGKWDQYINQEVVVRSSDWSVIGKSIIRGLDPVNDAIQIDALGFTPQPGYIVESPKYDDTHVNAMSFWKRVHAYLNPMVKVVAMIGPKVIEVSPLDLDKFFVNSVISIHSPDYTSVSNEVSVKGIDPGTNRLTLSANLNYTIEPDDHIELIGFREKGMPYRIV